MRFFTIIFLLFACKLAAQTDTIAPETHLKGAHCIAICKGSLYADSGCVFSNPADSVEEIVITMEGSFLETNTQERGVFKLRYKATDSTGNFSFSEWRIINVLDSAAVPDCIPIALNCSLIDTIPPKITLVGDPVSNVCQCLNYRDEGYVVSDNIDSPPQIIIEVEGSFLKDSTKKQGLFSLRYKATDRSGNISYSQFRGIFVNNPNEFPCDFTCGFPPEDTLDIPDNIRNMQSAKIFKLYPNPAAEELFIESNQFINTIIFYNTAGQKMQQININQNLNLPFKIDTKHFPAGIYMVQLKNASGILTKKIEIRR